MTTIMALKLVVQAHKQRLMIETALRVAGKDMDSLSNDQLESSCNPMESSSGMYMCQTWPPPLQ